MHGIKFTERLTGPEHWLRHQGERWADGPVVSARVGRRACRGSLLAAEAAATCGSGGLMPAALAAQEEKNLLQTSPGAPGRAGACAWRSLLPVSSGPVREEGQVLGVLSVAEVLRASGRSLGGTPSGGQCCARAIPGRVKTTKQPSVSGGPWALLGAPGGAVAVARGRIEMCCWLGCASPGGC